jgi:hypothetical protein
VVVTVCRFPAAKIVEPTPSADANSKNTSHGSSSEQVNPNFSTSPAVHEYSTREASCAASSNGNSSQHNRELTATIVAAGDYNKI